MAATESNDEMRGVFAKDHLRIRKTLAEDRYDLTCSTLLSYPANFSYRANVLAISLDIN